MALANRCATPTFGPEIPQEWARSAPTWRWPVKQHPARDSTVSLGLAGEAGTGS